MMNRLEYLHANKHVFVLDLIQNFKIVFVFDLIQDFKIVSVYETADVRAIGAVRRRQESFNKVGLER